MYHDTKSQDPRTADDAIIELDLSLFIISHDQKEVNLRNQARAQNPSIHKMIQSIKQKMPDRKNLYNKQAEEEFYNKFGQTFDEVVQTEFNYIQNFLDYDSLNQVINQKYNFNAKYQEKAVKNGAARVNAEDLKQFFKECFNP